MSTPLELKVDRIEKMLIEAMEMIGRLENTLSLKIEAAAQETRQIRADVDQSHAKAALRFITYEEDLRQMRIEHKSLEERVRAIEEKNQSSE